MSLRIFQSLWIEGPLPLKRWLLDAVSNNLPQEGIAVGRRCSWDRTDKFYWSLCRCVYELHRLCKRVLTEKGLMEKSLTEKILSTLYVRISHAVNYGPFNGHCDGDHGNLVAMYHQQHSAPSKYHTLEPPHLVSNPHNSSEAAWWGLPAGYRGWNRKMALPIWTAFKQNTSLNHWQLIIIWRAIQKDTWTARSTSEKSKALIGKCGKMQEDTRKCRKVQESAR